jgi:hypothetical protein
MSSHFEITSDLKSDLIEVPLKATLKHLEKWLFQLRINRQYPTHPIPFSSFFLGFCWLILKRELLHFIILVMRISEPWFLQPLCQNRCRECIVDQKSRACEHNHKARVRTNAGWLTSVHNSIEYNYIMFQGYSLIFSFRDACRKVGQNSEFLKWWRRLTSYASLHNE